MGDVHVMPGSKFADQTKPNDELVWALKQLLELAEAGTLRALWATGITIDGFRSATHVIEDGIDAYQGLGAIEALKLEYIDRSYIIGKKTHG